MRITEQSMVERNEIQRKKVIYGLRYDKRNERGEKGINKLMERRRMKTRVRRKAVE